MATEQQHDTGKAAASEADQHTPQEQHDTAPARDTHPREKHGRTPLGIQWRKLRLRWLRVSDPLLGGLRRRWRRSLRTRAMTIAVVSTLFLVVAVGALILGRISGDLYNAQRDQALQDSAQATSAAQGQLDASDAADRAAMATLVTSVRNTVQGASSSQLIYVRRQAGQNPSALAPVDFSSSPDLVDAVTPELSEALISGEAPQYWQAVTLVDDRGQEVPGILVGSTLVFPSGAGKYDLFIGYSLKPAQHILGLISSALAVMAVLLVLLLGLMVWSVSGLVFKPVRVAATASRRIARGEEDVRIPLQGDRHFDELSENFNEMADTLEARIEELDTLSTMQQRFVSDVSHELRTPLTTIRLAVEVLRGSENELNETQVRTVEVLAGQVDRFEALLADLLEISRYDAGPVVLETEPTNVVNLVQEVVEGLRPLSPSLIEVRTFGGFGQVNADPRRIRRIVSNLVGNAIEHGEGKAIEVTIDSNSTALAVTVRDWGVGMTPEQTERVFDRFWRGDPSRKRTLGGTGLGLAIAREDALAHGGQLEVWSRAGEGTNFRLTLPREGAGESYVSPLPLVPEDVSSESELEATAGWLRKAGRAFGRKKSELEK